MIKIDLLFSLSSRLLIRLLLQLCCTVSTFFNSFINLVLFKRLVLFMSVFSDWLLVGFSVLVWSLFPTGVVGFSVVLFFRLLLVFIKKENFPFNIF